MCKEFTEGIIEIIEEKVVVNFVLLLNDHVLLGFETYKVVYVIFEVVGSSQNGVCADLSHDTNHTVDEKFLSGNTHMKMKGASSACTHHHEFCMQPTNPT